MKQKKTIHPIENISAHVLTHSCTLSKYTRHVSLQEEHFLIDSIALVIREKIV